MQLLAIGYFGSDFGMALTWASVLDFWIGFWYGLALTCGSRL